jgi:hypothetical protein
MFVDSKVTLSFINYNLELKQVQNEQFLNPTVKTEWRCSSCFWINNTPGPNLVLPSATSTESILNQHTQYF